MFKTCTIDNKNISYTEDTVFIVQIGKNDDSYTTKNSFKGDPYRAVMCYNMINIGRGCKKRLIAPTLKPQVIARQL